jgi:hypothetical protein
MATHGSQEKVCSPIVARNVGEAVQDRLDAGVGRVQRGAASRRGMLERAATEELMAFGRRLV